ncbi:MAG: hypothetical protein ACRYFZ_20195 [Janthinobacterium lividum]
MLLIRVCYLLFWLALSAGAVRAAAPADTVRLPSRRAHDVAPPTRRWRGTIGQQAVTLTLNLDSGRWGYSGSYYYDHRGQAIHLNQEKPTPRAPIVTLAESVNGTTTGYFVFNGPAGPQLAGTWRSPDGRRKLPFALQETYADAVQYQDEAWRLTRYSPMATAADSMNNQAMLYRQYLRISLPQRPAASQRLRQALAAPLLPALMPHYLDTLAARRQALRPDYFYTGYKWVVYNSNYLLSVVESTSFKTDPQEEDSTGMYTHEWSQGSTFDLHTGRRLALADLLRPGYQPRLRQLVLKALRTEWGTSPYSEVGRSGRLPAGGFYLSPTGLCFYYDDRDDSSLAFPAPYHADREIQIELLYASLLPLINLAGPLAPLLQERRLLPLKQP